MQLLHRIIISFFLHHNITLLNFLLLQWLFLLDCFIFLLCHGHPLKIAWNPLFSISGEVHFLFALVRGDLGRIRPELLFDFLLLLLNFQLNDFSLFLLKPKFVSWGDVHCTTGHLLEGLFRYGWSEIILWLFLIRECIYFSGLTQLLESLHWILLWRQLILRLIGQFRLAFRNSNILSQPLKWRLHVFCNLTWFLKNIWFKCAFKGIPVSLRPSLTFWKVTAQWE